MLKNDYMMRVIQEFTQALGTILGLKNAGRHEDARELIEQTLMRLLGIDGKCLATMPDDMLMTLLCANGVLDADKTVAVGKLQKEAGDLFDARGDGERAYLCRLRALNLYLEVYLHGARTFLPEYADEIEPLAAALAVYKLPVPAMDRLWRYYEKKGDFAAAEDLLHELLEETESDPVRVKRGVDFYRRLLQRSDAELAAGNLPRDEVEEGIKRLESANPV